jgi:hypothetical protein
MDRVSYSYIAIDMGHMGSGGIAPSILNLGKNGDEYTSLSFSALTPGEKALGPIG